MNELKKQTVSGIKWLVGSSLTLKTSALFFAHHVIYFLKKILRKEGGCPILAYHKINDRDTNDKYAVGIEDFERQMKYLFKRGFRTISLAEYLSFIINHKRIPPKCFVLTFDDGYEDFYLNALPILKKYNFNAIVFIIANLVGKENEWDIKNGYLPTRLMDLAQIKELIEEGMEIGSHSSTHPDLSTCSSEILKKEIEDSKDILEKETGHKIIFFAYPYGRFNDKAKEIIIKSGYTGACAVTEYFTKDNFVIPRIAVANNYSVLKMYAKITGTYYKLKNLGLIN